jgi:hypothetical protein
MKSSSIAIMAGVSLGVLALVACGKKDETPADTATTGAAGTTAAATATVTVVKTNATATATVIRDAGAAGAAAGGSGGATAGGAGGAAAGGAGGAKGGAGGATAAAGGAAAAAGGAGGALARPPGIIRLPGKKLASTRRRFRRSRSKNGCLPLRKGRPFFVLFSASERGRASPEVRSRRRRHAGFAVATSASIPVKMRAMRTAVVSRVLVGGLTPLLILACGPTPVPQPPPAPAPSASAPIPVAAPAVDLSPVEQPAGIAGVVRLKSAKATLGTIEKVLRLPMPLEQILEKELRDPDIIKILKLDATVDGVVQLDPAAKDMSPDVLAAFSIPLRDFQEARRIAETRGKVTDRRGGMFTFHPKGMHGGSCLVAQSTGDAPARLLCGQHERDLDALVPWMTRGLPGVSLGASDLHAEVRLVPVKEKFHGIFENKSMIGSIVTMAITRFAPIQDPVFSEAIGDTAAEGVAFVGDLELLTLDGVIDPAGNGATLTAKAKYAKMDSWLAKSINQKNDKMAPAPGIFWSAPKSADAVTYSLGGDPKLIEPLKKRLATLLSSVTKAKLGDADRKAIEDLVNSMPAADAMTASAAGHIAPPAARPEPAKAGGKSSPLGGDDGRAEKSPQEKVDAAVGWRLTGVETDSKPWAKWFGDLAALYNRAGIQKALKEIDPNAPKMVKVKKGAATGYPAGTSIVEITVDAGGMFAPSFAPPPMVMEAPPTKGGKAPKIAKAAPMPKAKPMPITLRIAVVPDGARTWIGVSANPDALKGPIKAALNGAPKEGQVGSRTDLEVFKTTPLIGGGFVAPRGLLDSAPKTEAVQAVLRGLPNKGETPMLMLFSGTAGPAPTSTFEIRLQKGTIDDLAAVAMLANLAKGHLTAASKRPLRASWTMRGGP